MLTIPCPTCGVSITARVEVQGDSAKLRDETRLNRRHFHLVPISMTCLNGHTWELF